MFKRTLTALVVGALTTPLIAQSQAGTQPTTAAPLFESVPVNQVSTLYPEDASIRQRNVWVNLDLLGSDDTTPQGPEDGVILNLFDDVSFVGVYQGSTPTYGGGYIAEFELHGEGHDHEHGHAFFSVSKDAVVATVQIGHELYKVNYVGNGQATVSEVDSTLEPECGTDHTHVIKKDATELGEGGGAGSRYTDHEIDVMVVYTDNARFTNGGEDGINALINLAIHETNWAYSRSDVWQRLMLVHTEEINWFEDGDDFGYLSDLRGTTDGVGDEVHALRDEYGADMVSLIYDTGGYCGVAYIMTSLAASFEADCFSVVRDSCATGYYSFAHELGHNMGSAHDRANAGSALQTYSYGWRTSDNAYRSIMSYSPGTRIATFSNPAKDAPNGLALGTATDNNAASINTSSTTISAFRSSRDYGHRVSTTMASNNGATGNMFDIKPKTDLEIWALGVNTQSLVSETFDVYVREGGYAGYENNSAAWDLWGSYSTTGSGQDNYTFIYPGTRSFEAGKTYGVFIDQSSYDGAADLFRYTNGVQSHENNYLRIESGVGRGSGGFAGAIYADRIWNGAIYYRGDAGQAQLETSMVSNNAYAGNMFDVDVRNDIVINSFDVNVDSSAVGASGTAHVDVWMKSGSYVGSESDMFDWTYVGTDLATVASGTDNYTRVAVGDIELNAGQTYSFYIHLASFEDGQQLRYINGTAGAFHENSDMRIYDGVGKTNIAFGSSISNRKWSGRINYSGDHSGPHLWMADLAGNQINTIFMAGCTPGALQYASWSVAGGGPQSSPWGTLLLSNPYQTLPAIAADSNGNAIITTYSPPQASGLTVWVQSLDVGTLELTNGANLLIQ